MIFPVYLSNRSFDDVLDLLLISNGFVSHYVYIKDFNRLMFNKNKCKNKKWFCKSCLHCFSGENVLEDHGKDCRMINGRQNVKLEKGFIEFKIILNKFLLIILNKFLLLLKFMLIMSVC